MGIPHHAAASPHGLVRAAKVAVGSLRHRRAALNWAPPTILLLHPSGPFIPCLPSSALGSRSSSTKERAKLHRRTSWMLLCRASCSRDVKILFFFFLRRWKSFEICDVPRRKGPNGEKENCRGGAIERDAGALQYIEGSRLSLRFSNANFRDNFFFSLKKEDRKNRFFPPEGIFRAEGHICFYEGKKSASGISRRGNEMLEILWCRFMFDIVWPIRLKCAFIECG